MNEFCFYNTNTDDEAREIARKRKEIEGHAERKRRKKERKKAKRKNNESGWE